MTQINRSATNIHSASDVHGTLQNSKNEPTYTFELKSNHFMHILTEIRKKDLNKKKAPGNASVSVNDKHLYLYIPSQHRMPGVRKFLKYKPAIASKGTSRGA